MSLDMMGAINNTFKSVDAIRKSYNAGEYIDGIYQEGLESESSHTVNIQPLTDKEISFLSIGDERINDVRKIFVNDGDLYSIDPRDVWILDGINGIFSCISLDNRPWRNYCKVIISRNDDSG